SASATGAASAATRSAAQRRCGTTLRRMPGRGSRRCFMDSLTEYERDQTLLRAGLHEAEVAFIEPGTRRTLARRLAEVERERDAAVARLREIEAGAPAVRELRDAAVALADMVEEAA